MFEEALRLIIGKMNQAKEAGLVESFALIGGLAVATWGVPRATQDIDFVIGLGGANPAGLSAMLGGAYEAGAEDDPLRGVLRARIVVEDKTIPIQCIVLPNKWSSVLFSSIELIVIEGVTVPVVSWHVLVLLKLYAGGPQDILDARTLLAVRQPTTHDLEELRRKAQTLGLSQELKDLMP